MKIDEEFVREKGRNDMKIWRRLGFSIFAIGTMVNGTLVNLAPVPTLREAYRKGAVEEYPELIDLKEMMS